MSSLAAGEVEQVARVVRAGEHDRSRPRAGTCRSSSSKRWLRAWAKLVITTSSGERIGRSPTCPTTRSARRPGRPGPTSACQSGTLSTTPPSTSRRPSWCTIGNTPGSAALARSAGLSGPRASTTSSPVSRSAAITRSGISRSANDAGRRAVVDQRREALAPEEVGAAAHDVPGPVDLPAGEHVVAAQLLPDRRELRDAGEVRGVGDGGAVERAGRGPDHHVGHDLALEQRAEHADLADALVAAARTARTRCAARVAAAAVARRPTAGRERRDVAPILRFIGRLAARPVGVVGRVVCSSTVPRSDDRPSVREAVATVRLRENAHAYTPPRSLPGLVHGAAS